MKRLKAREFALLTVPVVALVCFGFMYKSRTPPLVLESAKVSDYRDNSGWGFNREIMLVVGHTSPSLWDRFFFNKRHIRTIGYDITDENGKRQWDKLGKGSIAFCSGTLPPSEPSKVRVRFRCDTTKISPSAGKMTFNTIVAIDDSELPVSVVINSK